MLNEAVEKRLKNILTVKWVGSETVPDTAIVDPGTFCETHFLRYVIEIFAFGFFYSLNVKANPPPQRAARREPSSAAGGRSG